MTETSKPRKKRSKVKKKTSIELKTYQHKRQFQKTPEPFPKKIKRVDKLPIFCVQKHAARSLHYDFRIECQGVMLSWAIPKGPSMDPHQKHLAVHVEDHPIDYCNFEGNIPAGNYGAGAVMIWDEGTFFVPKESTKKEMEKQLLKGLKEGHIEIELQGKKLKGGFLLQRLKKDNDKDWLLIKRKDTAADQIHDILKKNRSVRTDRTIEEIANDEKSVSQKKKFDEIKAPKKKLPSFIKPMLATLVDDPFDHEEWLFEIKWDGYRTLARLDKKVELLSRNEKSFNKQFPSIVNELRQMKVQAYLDGEIVILDKKGRSQFQLMQNFQREDVESHLFYYVFDLLFLDGKDLRELPLIERKQILKNLISRYSFSKIRYGDHIEFKGKAIFKEAQKQKLEGVIAKKMNSIYVSRRSREWLKIKTHRRQEVIIAGFTAPRGGRKHFGALLMGVYDNNKNLIFIGKVGTGFDSSLLRDLAKKMHPLIQLKGAFINPPKNTHSITWIKPKLVAEISFSEWTNDEKLRQPVFMGLRMDKKAKEVKKEVEIPMIQKKESVKKNKKQDSQKEVGFSNLQKIFWPRIKKTKGDLLHYYQEVADYILPYLKNHPVMIKRFPNGVNGESFIQKDSANLKLPSWVKTVEIEHEKKTISYFLIQDLQTLEYVVNLGTIEFHPFLSEIQKPESPNYFVIDLDPEAVGFEKVIQTAQTVHQVLKELKVASFCKTSGKRGLHICIPMGRKYTFDEALNFGQIIAQYIHSLIPEITSLIRQPSQRQNKVYLDVLQNHYKQTVIAPYSARGTEWATVSTPLKWSEVKEGLDPKDFTIGNIPQRLKKVGDLFKPVLGPGINIQAAFKKLQTKLNDLHA